MRKLIAIVAAVACSGSQADNGGGASSSPRKDSVAPPVVAAAPGDPRCPANGLWAECSVLYRLERAGFVPHLDSTARVEEKVIGAGTTSFVVKIGLSARLEVFVYPDSTARLADGKKLDRTQFVGATDEQTIRRERTLIENGNLIGLLTSLNSHQRERVSDALTAGAPQPTKP